MKHIYVPSGVCSRRFHFELSDSGIIESIEIEGGCNGNLQGIANLAQGRRAEDLIGLLEGIRCGERNTSCPDQLACALREALAR